MTRRVCMPADIRFPLERANGVQIVKTAAALARGGSDVTLLVRRSDERPTAEILQSYGVEALPALHVRRLPVLHRRGWFAVPRVTFLLRAGLAAGGSLCRGDVVYTRDLQLADWLLRLPRQRPRLVYEAHAVEASMYAERAALYGSAERFDPRKGRRIAAREGRVWSQAAGVVVTTAGIRDTLTDIHGSRSRVQVIPNGCDVAAGQEFPGLTVGRPARILYAGQLYPWKGVDVLVDAMTRVHGARLVILGGIPGEKDMQRVQRRVQEQGLAQRVELRGSVPQVQVARELEQAAVVAVPFLKSAMTERHTSPIKLFEALAAARPVVASDLPSSREVLRHEDNALLVPPGDPVALAAALQRLLDDAALAERLARAAAADARHYSWDARARRLAALFAELP